MSPHHIGLFRPSINGTGAPHDPFFHKPANRVIDLNDVFGDHESVFERSDPQARVTKLIRSHIGDYRREFDVFGRDGAVPYLVAETLRLLREKRDCQCYSPKELQRYFSQKTLLLANCEPRDKEGEGHNGNDFLIARVDDVGLQVVGSPIAFSNIKDQIHPNDLYCYPTEAGYLFPAHDQFRSSQFELASWKPKELRRADRNRIPDPEPRPHLTYVDRFGNQTLGTANDDRFQRDLDLASVPLTKGRWKGQEAHIVGLEIGGKKIDVHVLGEAALGPAHKGELIQYRNATRGKVHNLVYGWVPGLTRKEKQERSPHARFGEPPEGWLVTIR